MISSVSSSGQMQKPMHKPPPPMTQEQEETVSGILSNYDSSSISSTEFESMIEEIKDAGIIPSKDLRNMLEDSGFEIPEEGGPQGVKGEEKPPPPEFMSELMNKLNSGEISEEEVQTFMQNLQNESDLENGSILDEYA